MRKLSRVRVSGVSIGAILAATCWITIHASEPAKPGANDDKQGAPADQIPLVVQPAPPATAPQPLAKAAEHGLEYLASQQHSDGGWGQGGGWRQGGSSGRVEGQNVEDPSDVGNTCIAALALIRSGSTPQQGPYAQHIIKAVAFINQRVEKSDPKSLYVTDVRDTQLQQKIGQYADTFLAAMLLSELKQQMPDDKSENQLVAALDKTIGKIETNQNQDGTFAGNHGWASILSQGLCSKGLNRAKQSGAKVKDETLNRDFAQADRALKLKKSDIKAKTEGTALAAGSAAPRDSRRPALAGSAAGGFADRGDAGVDIYNLSANTSRLQDRMNSNSQATRKAKQVLADPAAPRSEKESAEAELKSIAANCPAQESAAREAVQDILKLLGDKQFIAGFGNNGGEEFLSYMNISETLFAKGGSDWEHWNKSVGENLEHVQNKDGSWSGQHCITGRTFCSAAALLTLMADRAPMPLAGKVSDLKR